MCKTKPRLSSLDWREMNLKDLGPEDTVLFDPPYPTTDVGSYTEATVDYVELVDTLLSAKFRWFLCGYLHPALHRLGNPFWAKEVRFLYFPVKEERKFGEERRIECLWRHSPNHESSTHHLAMPAALRTKIRIQDRAASLSFATLDEKIDAGLKTVANDWSALVPYLLEMHRRLSAPGKRTDLRKGAPAGLTWTAWVESKRHKLGRSLRTIQYMLRGQTEASKARQALAQPHANLRSEPDWSTPDTPMEVATEMSRLVLEMRDEGNSPSTKLKQRRLELLAEHFLRITMQESESDSVARIGDTSSKPGFMSLKM